MRTSGNGKLIVLSMIFLFIAAGLFLESCYDKEESLSGGNEPFSYVGDQKCISCHTKESNEWRSSDHFMAMLPANDSTVVGSFSGDSLDADGILSVFYKKDDAFYVRTEGPDGDAEEFRVRYIFGHYPLQQYLVEFPGGRMQALRQTWDTERNQWFHQYPGEKIPHHDWLHWTRGAQTWNSMCADCHSTDLKKQYSFEADSFHTTWSDMNVSCESCHGPGSRHVTLAEAGYDSYVSSEHFVIDLSDTNNVKQVEVCAPCHSRRSELGGRRLLTGRFFDNYMPEVISTQHYHPDGQIDDENYVYGSFVQSKMYMHNVRCTNCHNPHSGKLKLEGNLLCHQCHDVSYSKPSHHFHEMNSEPAQCISCHMPAKYYMGNDLRHDHSFRIPRPDQSVLYGTPNACNNCHNEKGAQWAADAISAWYGTERTYHFSDDLIPGSMINKNSGDYLLKLLLTDSVPEIARATALYYLSLISYMNDPEVFIDHTHHSSPSVRIQALRALQNYPYSMWVRSCLDLLQDEFRSVRITAYELFMAVPENEIPQQYRSALEQCRSEYEQYLEHQLDLPLGRASMGLYMQRKGDIGSSIRYYESALHLDDKQTGIRTNLAISYNSAGKNEEAERVLTDELKLNPSDGSANYNLALLYVEMRDTLNALKYFEKSVELMPWNIRAHYNFGLLLQSTGQSENAANVFRQGLKSDPMDHDLNYVLFLYHYKKADMNNAMIYLEKLAKIDPSNQMYSKTLEELKSAQRN
jgi:tetratricopeptide (TPR) repeat protein